MTFWDLDRADRGQTAIVDPESAREWSWGELDDRVDELASRLDFDDKPLGFLFCDRSPDQIAAYLACLRQRAAIVLLDAEINAAARRRLLERYQPRFVWHPSPSTIEAPDWKPRSDAPDDRLLVHTRPTPGPIHPDLAVALSTSGTTGSPKLVRLSYENLASNAAAITDYLDLDEDSRAITSLPVEYAYGLSIVNSRLAAGGSLICTDASPTTRPFWDAFDNHGCTSLSGVPFMWRVFRRLRLGRRSLDTLRVMTQAGGPLARPLAEHFHRVATDHGARFFIMYGQTEATARMSFVPPSSLSEKADTIGTALPGGEFSLTSVDGLDDTEADGELVYQGPNVMMGYAHSREDLADGDTQGNRLATGDLAYRDDDSHYVLVGRRSRFAKIYGRRISTDHLATRIRDKFDREVACLPGDDIIHIVLAGGDDVDEAVQTFLVDSVGLNDRALQIHTREGLPHTSAGKIDVDALDRELTDD